MHMGRVNTLLSSHNTGPSRLGFDGVIGLGASWGLARLMTSFLFDVTAQDPLVSLQATFSLSKA